jgi:hypothetical protein
MSILGWLQQSLEQHQQNGCEKNPEAEKFVSKYGEYVESEKQTLKERQEQTRQERASK